MSVPHKKTSTSPFQPSQDTAAWSTASFLPLFFSRAETKFGKVVHHIPELLRKRTRGWGPMSMLHGLIEPCRRVDPPPCHHVRQSWRSKRTISVAATGDRTQVHTDSVNQLRRCRSDVPRSLVLERWSGLLGSYFQQS